jgi:hypothetical protein
MAHLSEVLAIHGVEADLCAIAHLRDGLVRINFLLFVTDIGYFWLIWVRLTIDVDGTGVFPLVDTSGARFRDIVVFSHIFLKPHFPTLSHISLNYSWYNFNSQMCSYPTIIIFIRPKTA